MKILAVSKAMIQLAIGSQDVVPCGSGTQNGHKIRRAGEYRVCGAKGSEECAESVNLNCDKNVHFSDETKVSSEHSFREKSPCNFREHFPNFVFQDRAGLPRLFDAPEVPYPLIIESYALSSQYERLALCGLSEPLFSLALNGEGFHGQGNRPWLAGKGNLHLCARIPMKSDAILPIYQLIPSLAVIRGLGGGFGLKWPNDIVTGEPMQKIGGALTTILSRDRALLFGIGVNLCRAPKAAMAGELRAASCYTHVFDFDNQSQIHHRVSRAVMQHLIEVYEALLRAPEKLLDEYRSRLSGLGRHVILTDSQSDEIIASGIFSNIDEEFSVCLEGHTTRYRDVRMRLLDVCDTHTRYITDRK